MAKKYKSILGESLFGGDDSSSIFMALTYGVPCGLLGYLGYAMGDKYLALLFVVVGLIIVYKFQSFFLKLIFGIIALVMLALSVGGILVILYVLYKLFEQL